MFRKITIGAVIVVAIIVAFFAFVATRNGHFHYERSGVIAAPPEVIFPYISDFKLGEQWSPFGKVDPHMKKTFSGPEGQVGSMMEFEGNKNVGSGKLEILKIVPNQMVQIRLTMLKPFYAENIVEYTLTPEATGTRFTWAMSGDNGFFGKLIGVFVNCEKMVGDQFTTGIQNLKALVEAKGAVK